MEEPEDGLPDRGPQEQLDEPPALRNGAGEEADQTYGATRITLRPHDRGTGEEIDKAEVVRGYEYERGHFVTCNADAVSTCLHCTVVGYEGYDMISHGDRRRS